MKQVNLVFAGAGDDYEDVGGQGTGTKWVFKDNPELECVLMARKQMKGMNGDYMLYNVTHRRTKVEYVIFCNKVLADRLHGIPLFSAVKINFLGIEPTKKYHKFSVGFDKKFIYNASEWEKKEDSSYNEVKREDTPTTPYSQSNNTSASAGVDDAPF